MPLPPTPPTNDGIEWGTLAQWVGPWVTSGVAIVLALVGSFSRRDEKALDSIEEKIEGLTENVGELYQQDKALTTRIATVENEIKHLASREDVGSVKAEVHTLKAVVEAKFDGLSRQLATIIAQNERAQDRLAEREDRK